MYSPSLTLAFIWKFLEPIIGDSIKIRFKQKSSSEKAREFAFELFETLGKISELTNDFVDELHFFINRKEKLSLSNSTSTIESIEELFQVHHEEKFIEDLRNKARLLMYELPRLSSALEEVNPQMDIHQHELVQKIIKYKSCRQRLLTELEESVVTINKVSNKSLSKILLDAKKNRNLIQCAVENMRVFLAEEFTFRDAF